MREDMREGSKSSTEMVAASILSIKPLLPSLRFHLAASIVSFIEREQVRWILLGTSKDLVGSRLYLWPYRKLEREFQVEVGVQGQRD